MRDDTIRLDGAVFSGLNTTGVLAADAFRVTTTSSLAQDADDRVIYHKSSGALYFDPDGIGGASAIQFAQLDAGLRLKAGDFFGI